MIQGNFNLVHFDGGIYPHVVSPIDSKRYNITGATCLSSLLSVNEVVEHNQLALSNDVSNRH